MRRAAAVVLAAAALAALLVRVAMRGGSGEAGAATPAAVERSETSLPPDPVAQAADLAPVEVASEEDGSVAGDSSTTASAASASAVQDEDGTPPAPTRIVGTVYGIPKGARDDRPLAGAKVVLYTGWRPTSSTVSDADGRFELPPVPASDVKDLRTDETLTVRAEAPMYRPAEETASLFSIAYRVHEVQLVLLEGPRLRGRVVEESGALAAGAEVTTHWAIHGLEGRPPLASSHAITDLGGEFCLPIEPVEPDHRLSLSLHAGLGRESGMFRLHEVPRDRDVHVGDLVLHDLTTLSATVVDPEGAPVAGVEVLALHESTLWEDPLGAPGELMADGLPETLGLHSGTRISEDGGRIRFEYVLPGDYLLRRLDEYDDGPLRVERRELVSTEDEDARLVLDVFPLTVQVLEADGRPAVGARVSVLSTDGRTQEHDLVRPDDAIAQPLVHQDAQLLLVATRGGGPQTPPESSSEPLRITARASERGTVRKLTLRPGLAPDPSPEVEELVRRMFQALAERKEER